MPPTTEERIATLEEAKRNQDTFNSTICITLDKIESHLNKIEYIAIAALILAAAKEAPQILTALASLV